MGRLSREHHEMQKKQLNFRLQDETVQKRLKICQGLLDSILKTRSGIRKNKYKNELKNVHEYLCLQAESHEQLKKNTQHWRQNTHRVRGKRQTYLTALCV